MPTDDPREALSLEEARRRIAAQAFAPPEEGEDAAGRVGLEPELFVFRPRRGGRELDRVRLDGADGVLALLDRATDGVLTREPGLPPRYRLANGGHLTFEPGAQVEHSTRPHATAAEALLDVAETVRWLQGAFAGSGAVLAALGADLWHDAAGIPQQLDAPRYHAMAAFFERVGPWGKEMMRNSASMQINLDLGPRAVAVERWALANLAAPIAVASFATSPKGGWASHRSRAWQELDPSRTGFPAAFLRGEEADPARQYAEFALDADVLLFRLAGGDAEVGEPGFRFRDWIERGHPRHGRPIADDLDYHLTTLFPEVRARRFLEIRCGDAVPARWRAAPVVFWAGLLYDRAARRAALARLEPWRAELPALWRRAAEHALRDDLLAELAGEVWEHALAGAARLPRGFLRVLDLERARAFARRYVGGRRTPGDELLEHCGDSPACGVAWAAEEEPGAGEGERV